MAHIYLHKQPSPRPIRWGLHRARRDDSASSPLTHSWYDQNMTTVKIAVTLPPEQVKAAKLAVKEGRAPSVSAYVSAALAQREESDGLVALIAEMTAEVGEPSEEDYAWARQALGLSA